MFWLCMTAQPNQSAQTSQKTGVKGADLNAPYK